MLARLRPLLDNLCGHPHRTRSYLAHTRCKHVYCRTIPRVASLSIGLPLGIVAYGLLGCKLALNRVVGDEEESSARRRPNNRTAYAPVDAIEASRGGEASRRLEPGFERVEGVEGEIYGCACEATCLGESVGYPDEVPVWKWLENSVPRCECVSIVLVIHGSGVINHKCTRQACN